MKITYPLKDLDLGQGSKNMKKILFIFLFFTFFNNLYSITNKDTLKLLSLEILANPVKIENIMLNCPDLFIQKFKTDYYFSDSLYINELIDFIENRFNKSTSVISFRELNYSYLDLEPLKEAAHFYNLDSANFYGFVVVRGELGIRFSFIKDSNNYSLIHIVRFPELANQLNDKFKVILQNPNLLKNLKFNFPNYYNEKYIDKSMLDSNWINNVIINIKRSEAIKMENPSICYFQFSENEFNDYNSKFLNNLLKNNEDYIRYSFYFDKINVDFIFYRIDGKIYLNRISAVKYIHEDDK